MLAAGGEREMLALATGGGGKSTAWRNGKLSSDPGKCKLTVASKSKLLNARLSNQVKKGRAN